MMKYIFLLLLFFFLSNNSSFAQNKEESAWISLSSNYKFSAKWGAYLDVQIRSSDHYSYLRQVIIRPGIAYHFNKNQTSIVGYSRSDNYVQTAGFPNNHTIENRFWEQFAQQHKIKKLFVTQRVRLEQRFLEVNEKVVYSQRFRYYTRFLLPLKKYDVKFEQGPYLAAQNEIYLNIQNKEKMNNHLVDQNRTNLIVGNRFNSNLDIELSFLNQYVVGLKTNTINRVAQLGVITRF